MPRPKYIKFRNESQEPCRYDDLEIDVKPGEEVEIPEGYAMPRRAASGDRFPSIVEQVAPQLKPVHAHDLARWEKAPEAPAPVVAKMPSVKDLVAAGMPEGLATMFVQSMHASLAEAKSALAEGGKPSEEDKGKEPASKPAAKKGQG